MGAQAGDDKESRQEQEGDRGLARGREGVNAHARFLLTCARTWEITGMITYHFSSLRRSAELSEM